MKINKKILLTTCGLGLIGLASLPILTSCSQGANVNLNQFDFNVNGETYRLKGNVVEKKVGDKWESYTFNTNGNYDKQDLNDGNFINKQKDAIKQNIYFVAANYLYNITNLYLNFLTRSPTIGNVVDNDKNQYTHLVYNQNSREFEIAYNLGAGEGKYTYRLKISSIDFSITEDKVWPTDNSYSYGKELGTKIEDVDAKKNVVKVSDINIALRYYRIDGNSSYEYVKLDDVKNSNYQSYWKNFKYDDKEITPTKEQFNIKLNDNLFFEVKPTYKTIKEGNNQKYIANGGVQVVGLTTNNNYLDWSFAFSSNDLTSVDLEAKVKIQKEHNKTTKDGLFWANEDFEKFKQWAKDDKNNSARDFLNKLITFN